MIERIKQVVAQVVHGLGKQHMGTVYDYDQATYAVRVQIQPTGEVTGWIPIGSEYVGNGFGLAIGPAIGDMVRIDPIDGSNQVFVVGKRFFNDIDQPLQVPSGECWLVHASGSLVKLTNDGKLLLNGNVEIDATGPIINITATGAVNVTAGTTATVTAPSIILKNLGTSLKKLCTDVFVSLFNAHVHTNGNGGANTGTPTTTAVIGTHTTNIVQAE